MQKRRIVVTGLGMLSPLGLSVSETWNNILAGNSGIEVIDEIKDIRDFPVCIGGRVKGFNPDQYIEAKESRRIDTFVQYAFVASNEAIKDAGLDFQLEDTNRIGVAIGSGIGGLLGIVKNHSIFIEKGPRRVSPFFIPGSIINMAAGYISIYYHLRGPNISIVTACTTGAHNIGYAARTISQGDADIMLAGGTEMATIPLSLAGFSVMRALSTRNSEPHQASRPWDKHRDGFVMGDGAGVLVLEEYEHAKKRNAKIYAELKGFGMSADGMDMTKPNEAGMKACMKNALIDAGFLPNQIQYINAHGTSTPLGDPIEAKSIYSVFEETINRLAVSSTKSMTGHLLGAAGAIEAIFTILALRDQIAPPTINLDDPDEDLNLDFIPHQARKISISAAMSNSFGFGGTNASLIFSKI